MDENRREEVRQMFAKAYEDDMVFALKIAERALDRAGLMERGGGQETARAIIGVKLFEDFNTVNRDLTAEKMKRLESV